MRLRGRTHGGPGRMQPCVLDLPLPGHGPASSGGLMTNSRPTGAAFKLFEPVNVMLEPLDVLLMLGIATEEVGDLTAQAGAG